MKTIEEFKRNYPVKDWVTSNNQLYVGAKFVYWSDSSGSVVEAIVSEVLGACQFEAREEGKSGKYVVDYYDTICFLVSEETGGARDCSCSGWELFNFGCRCGYVASLKDSPWEAADEGLYFKYKGAV